MGISCNSIASFSKLIPNKNIIREKENVPFVVKLSQLWIKQIDNISNFFATFKYSISLDEGRIVGQQNIIFGLISLIVVKTFLSALLFFQYTKNVPYIFLTIIFQYICNRLYSNLGSLFHLILSLGRMVISKIITPTKISLNNLYLNLKNDVLEKNKRRIF